MKLSGLQKICRVYGGIVVNGDRWIWDYALEKAVLESELKAMEKSERDKRRAESERAKWSQVKMDLKGGE